MKSKFTLLVISLLLFNNIIAQQFHTNFLGKDFINYKNTFFKINPTSDKGYSYSFYSKIGDCEKSYNENVIYPVNNEIYRTNKDSLLNKVFLVENIFTKKGIVINDVNLLEEPVFLLKELNTNNYIYYKYDVSSEYYFPFLTSEIKYNTIALCEKIERVVDEFTNEISINSPFSEADFNSPVVLYKSIKNGKSVYYLSLDTYGSTLNVLEKGVSILFTDGTKFNKPLTSIDVDADGDGYKYSAFIPLTLLETKFFTTKQIKKFRLYIYDEEVSTTFSEKFKHYVKCVIEKK